MKIKISEKWKKPFRLALVLILLGIFLVLNRWGVDFQISFHFKTAPTERVTPAKPALRTQVFEDSIIRYRDRLTQSLDVRFI